MCNKCNVTLDCNMYSYQMITENVISYHNGCVQKKNLPPKKISDKYTVKEKKKYSKTFFLTSYLEIQITCRITIEHGLRNIKTFNILFCYRSSTSWVVTFLNLFQEISFSKKGN